MPPRPSPFHLAAISLVLLAVLPHAAALEAPTSTSLPARASALPMGSPGHAPSPATGRLFTGSPVAQSHEDKEDAAAPSLPSAPPTTRLDLLASAHAAARARARVMRYGATVADLRSVCRAPHCFTDPVHRLLLALYGPHIRVGSDDDDDLYGYGQRRHRRAAAQRRAATSAGHRRRRLLPASLGHRGGAVALSSLAPLALAADLPDEYTKLNHTTCGVYANDNATGAADRARPVPGLRVVCPRPLCIDATDLEDEERRGDPLRVYCAVHSLEGAASPSVFFPWRNTWRAHLPVADPGAAAASGDRLCYVELAHMGYYIRCPDDGGHAHVSCTKFPDEEVAAAVWEHRSLTYRDTVRPKCEMYKYGAAGEQFWGYDNIISCQTYQKQQVFKSIVGN
ncbi:unnamed protein product [Urochloa decumbens]|uniref:Uncharacterized protein n=1 Tax=Urochloa decumbens TaxID=240449 RepID=A0ABC9BN97_9POAL